MSTSYVWLTVLVIAVITAVLRFLPFAIWSKKRSVPPMIEKFGRLLPYPIMGMLVVYCLKDIDLGSASGFMPELISCIVVAILHIIKRNSLISILCGTICYMLLVQSGIF